MEKAKKIFFTFTFNEKLKHYTAVATGRKPTIYSNNFISQEQQSYAKGQMDARNEQNRIYKFKNSTPEEQQAYKEKKALEYAKYKASKE